MVYFPVKDHLGQPKSLLVIDETLSQERYGTPFGETHSEYKLSGVGEQNLRFPGQYYDMETGFHYNNQRYYIPDLGKYSSADWLDLLTRNNDPQIGASYLTGGVGNTVINNHLFAYVVGNPVNWWDFYGLSALSPQDLCEIAMNEACQKAHDKVSAASCPVGAPSTCGVPADEALQECKSTVKEQCEHLSDEPPKPKDPEGVPPSYPTQNGRCRVYFYRDFMGNLKKMETCPQAQCPGQSPFA